MNTFLVILGYILVCWLACLLIRLKSGVSYDTSNGKFNMYIHSLMLRAKKAAEASESKLALKETER